MSNIVYLLEEFSPSDWAWLPYGIMTDRKVADEWVGGDRYRHVIEVELNKIGEITYV